MQAALRLLRARDRTEAELRLSLLTKGFKEPEVGLVLKTLAEARYVDDRRVAERVVEKSVLEASGHLLVEHRLRERGVGPDEAEGALGSLPDQAELAERAFWKLRKPGDTPARAASRLERKGFDEETVRAVIERHFPEFD
jgi:regulatory protein